MKGRGMEGWKKDKDLRIGVGESLGGGGGYL
jgi:hypothetical protein